MRQRIGAGRRGSRSGGGCTRCTTTSTSSTYSGTPTSPQSARRGGRMRGCRAHARGGRMRAMLWWEWVGSSSSGAPASRQSGAGEEGGGGGGGGGREGGQEREGKREGKRGRQKDRCAALICAQCHDRRAALIRAALICAPCYGWSTRGRLPGPWVLAAIYSLIYPAGRFRPVDSISACQWRGVGPLAFGSRPVNPGP